MFNEIRLLIADDHPIFRQGLRQVIERESNLKVVAEVGDGQAALEQIAALRPAIVILDIDMPQMDGFSVARALQKQHLAVQIIFLTVHSEEDFFNEALALGAKGYVLKDSAVTDIVSSIRAVMAGQHYTSPALTSYLVGRRRPSSLPAKPRLSLDLLTPTERQILKLIAEYKTSKEIAELLYISPHTVRTHRKNICLKLELQGSHALMKFALEHESQL
ncbi:MAG: response regulator transcription factor [Acidobacteriota bacterium]|nr:response regulator transcription factor [Blastocatellia bacterium]MDW8239032.1 response regulator transcription factor [Acidobacteriota bacterium]